jgi:hypothetical protein
METIGPEIVTPDGEIEIDEAPQEIEIELLPEIDTWLWPVIVTF